MIKQLIVFTRVAVLLIFFTSGLSAQNEEISRGEFLAILKKSEVATKAIPFRNSVTIETGGTSAGPWEPYSSMVEERVLPDRSYLIYTSRILGEVLRVGKLIYRKGPDGNWVRQQQEAEGWLVNPASVPVFSGPVVEYWSIPADEDSENSGTIVKVVSKPKEGTPMSENSVLTYIYYFDESGLLYKHRSTAFNGTKWLSRVEKYEYDPKIQIEAPTK